MDEGERQPEPSPGGRGVLGIRKKVPGEVGWWMQKRKEEREGGREGKGMMSAATSVIVLV